jgi:plasmid stabilization system protein ParE
MAMSGSPYELTALARLDLLQAWNHLATEASISVADRVLQDLESAILNLVAMPGIGHKRQDLTSRRLLFFRVHSYLIVYRPETNPMRIIRVLHGARNIKAILR